MSTIEIIPTYVPRDLEDLARGAELIRSFASVIHVDVDDGVFAPHTTWPYTSRGNFKQPDLSALAGLSIEVHLMVEESREIGAAFARAGAARIIGHVEGFADINEIHSALHSWREAGAREVGLGMLMQTPFEVIAPVVDQCDVVHLMTIATIGTQGIRYESNAPDRIAEFHSKFPETLISVDGGVSEKNIVDLARAGARHFGVGSAIMKASDPQTSYKHLLEVAQGVVEIQ